MNNIDSFVETYRKELSKAIQTYPDKYVYGLEAVPSVVEKMSKAFIRGSFLIDGYAIKQTCKTLGIKVTYKAIASYIKGES